MLFTLSHIVGHLYCFLFLAISNTASMSISVQVFVWIYAFVNFGQMLEVEWLVQILDICLTF